MNIKLILYTLFIVLHISNVYSCHNKNSQRITPEIKESLNKQKLITRIANDIPGTKNFVSQFINNYPKYINDDPEEIVYFQDDLTLAHFLIRSGKIEYLEPLVDSGEMLYGQDKNRRTPFIDFCYFVPSNSKSKKKQAAICQKILSQNDHVLYAIDPISKHIPYAVINLVVQNQVILNVFNQHYDSMKKNLKINCTKSPIACAFTCPINEIGQHTSTKK